MGARPTMEQTLYNYAWSFDSGRIDEIGACFTKDAEVEFDSGLRVGRTAVVAELQRRRGSYPEGLLLWHAITNVFVRGETEHGLVVASYFTFILQAPGEEPRLSSVGYYDDVLTDEGEEWQISHRRIRHAHDR
jgi:hypothetical protein